MSRLSRRIRECEAAIGADRRIMTAAVTELRADARRRAGSMSALCVSFGGGLVLGLISGGRRKPSHTASGIGAPARAASPSVASSMVARLARDVLWPVGMGALQVHLSRLLIGGDSQRR